MLIRGLTRRFSAFVTGWPERPAFIALAGAVSLVLVSIAASQILLAAAIAGAILLWQRGGRSIRPWPPFVWPLLFFIGWTIIAVFGSHDIPRGLGEIKKFFLYLILFLVPLIARNKYDPVRIYRAIFLVSAVSASAGLVQFFVNPNLDLLHRISGFMSHWMTYSGLLMLVLVVLSAYAVGDRDRKDWWVFPLGLILVAGMYLSETRNAWLGSAAGLATVLLLRRPRATFGLVVLLVAFYLFSPASTRQRLRSGWDPNDPNTRNRIELFETSVRLIRNNPWLGVGPKSVNREALRYRGTNEFPDWMYQHMHNNFLQIAAERGIPGLLLWLWFMVRLAWDALVVFRSAAKDPSGNTDHGAETALMVSTAALGAWIALLVGGMFEYNFGDSEVLTLFLFIMAAPYVFLQRARQDNGAGKIMGNPVILSDE